MELEGNMVHFLGRDIHFPNAYGPSQDAACWFNKGPLCSAGREEHTHTHTHNTQAHRHRHNTQAHRHRHRHTRPHRDRHTLTLNKRLAVLNSVVINSISYPGVNLILAVSIFLGVMVTIFLLMALLYCVR